MAEMKALTIQQPWAWAIATGYKTIEKRSRTTGYREGLAIHAGAAWSARGQEDPRIRRAWNANGEDTWKLVRNAPAFHQGAIIALAEVVNTHEAAEVRGVPCCYQAGGDLTYNGKTCWHWMLADVHPLPEPIPCRGQLGLWTVPGRLIEGAG